MSNAAHWSVITFFGYTAGVFVLAIASHRLLQGRNFLSEYFLGSRGLGFWALAMTYAATSSSGGSFTGFPALIYKHGWILALWISSYMLVPVTCMAVLGKRLNQVARKSGAITLPDVLRDRFRNPKLGILVSLTLVFFLVANLVAQFKAGGVILQVLLADQSWFTTASQSVDWLPSVIYFGDPSRTPSATYCLALLLFAGGVILYTTYGGFRAVVWTDVLQGVVMFVGVLILLPLAIYKAGGMGQVTETLAQTPLVRMGEVVLQLADEPGGETVTIPAETKIVIHHGETRQPFVTFRSATLDEHDRHPARVVIHAVQPDGMAATGQEGPGTNVLFENLEQPKHINVLSYQISPKRNLISGPGPSDDQMDGFLPLGLAISFFTMWAITGIGQPGTLVRLMAFDNTKVYRRAIFVVVFYYSLIYLPLVIIFVCARSVIQPTLAEPDQVMAKMVTTVAPPILAGVLLAAPFAAIMSTVDSFLLMISSSLVRDVYQRSIHPKATAKTIRRGSYATTVLIGVVVTLGALNPPKFLQDLIVFTTGGMACCYLAPMVLCLYWKRSTSSGMVASIVAGFFTVVALYSVNWFRTGTIAPFNLLGFFPIGWGVIVSFVAGILGSLLSAPPPKDLVDHYFTVPREKPTVA